LTPQLPILIVDSSHTKHNHRCYLVRKTINMKYVTYLRVSTKEQGKSGLGLDAQKRDIRLYLDNYSTTPYKVLKEFLEVDSGANSARTTLNDAINLAKKHDATLLVAKLDRLSRKVSFIASLMEDRKLNFKVATMPHADPFNFTFTRP
jgi:DNA invertase Pin-like site-specific DNA recombinase